MTKAIDFTLKISAVVGTSLASWCAGQYYERCQQVKDEKNNIYNIFNLKRMPGLPIFGTVSAASPIVPNDNQIDMGNKLSSTTSRISQIMKRNRIAHWVFEHLTRDGLYSENKSKVDRSKCEFKPDESIHPYFRSLNSDYKGSGFDRGHLAAAGNHKLCQNHMEQTFFLSNMAPQVGVGFNRDSWNRLEKYVRKLTKVYTDVYVCTGPLYLPKKEGDGKKYVRYQVIGANHVAVPTHFYKVIVGQTNDLKFEMEAYVMPNGPIDDNTPLTSFQVPPESVERAAGLLFFDKLSRDKLTKINGKKV
ncbi:endonuclease G, mitochondrial isoform X2 [Diachasma alloeum]|uniref:endonuclease G, mitochondrial isoform X2 n=1 Tax=Diachasma alloeum TaxID=454923 RepID=UPI0007382EFC|nr:endonuclease G, mitochondrial isoform X2 [Diachasma alloeum]